MGVPMEYGVPTTNVGQSTGSSLLGALPVVGGVANAVSSFFTNQAQIKANKEAYERQRADSLADWNMQNKYNSPSQQMQRFKEAGLNPNLVYGQMSNSPVVRSTDYKAPNYVAPQIEPSSLDVLSRSNNYQLQAKNIQQADATRALTEANTIKANSETNWKNLNTKYLEQSMPYNLEGIQLKNAETIARTNQIDEQWNLTRQQRSLVPEQYNKLKSEVSNINNIMYYRNISEPIQNDIRRIIRDSGALDLGNKPTYIGLKNEEMELNNAIQQIEKELRPWKLGSQVVGDILSGVRTAAETARPRKTYYKKP